jgi:CBS domain containing-hemolysin-like protein
MIWLLNGSARIIITMFGLHSAKEHDEVHSEKELRIIMSDSLKSGEINEAEYEFVNRIFEFDNRLAREIMVPRTDMVCLHIDSTFEDNINTILKEKYTRFPVIREDKDNIIGFINTKEFFLQHYEQNSVDISQLVKPLLVVQESIFIKDLLAKMQLYMSHMALLIDEYGGTSGIVTIEDILEEIVGEIKDEFDYGEAKPVEKIDNNHYIISGNLLLEEINDLFYLEIDSDNSDTIAGWLSERDIPLKEGGQLSSSGVKFIIKEIDGYRIRRLEVIIEEPHCKTLNKE